MTKIKLTYMGVMNSIGKEPNGFTKAMDKVFDYTEVSNLLDVSDDCQYLFLQTQSNDLDIQQLNRLHKSPCFVVNWTGDVRTPIPDFYFHYAPYVDITAFSNMHDVNILKGLGWPSEFLQIGYDPEIYFPGPSLDDLYKLAPAELQKVPEIVFMGNRNSMFPLSQFRYDMVMELQRVFGDRFGVYGNNWPNARGNFNHNQHAEAAVYRAAKIAINLSHFDYERYSSDRLFRALGCGIMVLSHKYQGIETDFTPDWNIATWEKIPDLIDWIHFYSKNENEWIRAGIGHSGHMHAAEKFTFECMAKNILELYNTHENA